MFSRTLSLILPGEKPLATFPRHQRCRGWTASHSAIILLLILGTTTATATGYQTGVSKHVGFDQYVVGVKADMETWWNDSPYFDVAFYLNGGYRGIDPATGQIPFDYNLDADWIATVSNEGWGLIPIWSDMQAPCDSRPVGSFRGGPRMLTMRD